MGKDCSGERSSWARIEIFDDLSEASTAIQPSPQILWLSLALSLLLKESLSVGAKARLDRLLLQMLLVRLPYRHQVGSLHRFEIELVLLSASPTLRLDIILITRLGVAHHLAKPAVHPQACTLEWCMLRPYVG